jgi:hypothetical protein
MSVPHVFPIGGKPTVRRTEVHKGKDQHGLAIARLDRRDKGSFSHSLRPDVPHIPVEILDFHA